MKIAAVILNWNRAELTEAAAQSVMSDVSQVYLVDNGSVAEQIERLTTFAEKHGMTLIRNGVNLGYAAGNNRAIDAAVRGGYDGILVMNNDAAAELGAVPALAGHLESESRLGVVQPTVVSAATGRVLHTRCSLDIRKGTAAWVDHGRDIEEIDGDPKPTGYVSGEAFLAKAEVFAQAGDFDERYDLYFEDVEWSLRVRDAGWRLATVPHAVFTHVVSASVPSLTGIYQRARNRMFFLRFGLGATRLAAARLSARRQLLLVGSLLRRGHVWLAVRGVVAGWTAGLIRAR